MNIKCPCCNTLMEFYPSVKNVYKCSNCSHIFRNYSTDIDYQEYYSEKYRKNTVSKLHPIEWRNNFAENVITFTQHYTSRNINSVLEIGAGDGLLSKKLTQTYPEVSTCEADDNLCKILLKNQEFKKVYCGDYFKCDFENKFDLVISIDVVEHIKPNDLTLFFEKTQSILSDNGYVVIQVPTQRRISDPNTNWDGHYHYFSENSFSELVKDIFKVKTCYNTKDMETARGKELIFLLEKK